ncbi:MAG: hypothetical protein IIC60_07235, partial [Proteobacteria bacterium]|nr:hypothetical protein [Pseudomonadota bacterium]
MNTDGDETATSEALATLKSIEDMERSVLKYTRPSVSVILAVSLLIGLQALLVTRVDGPTQSGDGFDLLLVLTTLLVVGLVGRFFYKLRK